MVGCGKKVKFYNRSIVVNNQGIWGETMKKSKLMMALLVGSMGLLGTGYAVFTQEVKINEQIQTGTFKLEIIPKISKVMYSYGADIYVDNTTKWPENKNPICTAQLVTANNTKNQYTFTIKKLIPGEEIRIPIEVINTGDIQATLESIVSEIINVPENINRDKVYVECFYNDTPKNTNLIDRQNGMDKVQIIPIPQGGHSIPVNGKGHIMLVIGLESDADNKYEDISIQAAVTVNFKQYIHAPKTSDTEDELDNQN